MKPHFDVVIVGGAVTGSVLALALSAFSQNKMRIGIIEKYLPNYTEQGGFDARSIALAYGSLQKLAQIRPLAFAGNLAQLVQNIATPIEQICVSDQGHFGKTTLKAEELKLTQLGVVVELAKLGEKLATLIAAQPNITLFCPNQIANLTRNEQQCELTLVGGETLSAQLLIAADGIQSPLAKQCGVPTQFLHNYQQSAIIANVELAQSHQHRAFERFTPEGPFALLPLTEKTMSLVWCVKDPSDRMTYSDEQFLHALQQQFGWILGKFLRVSKRFVYPLSSQKAISHIHHRLAIVGNASQLLHPVAGQGFNLGLRDLFELATLLGKAFMQGEDVGNSSLLHQFERARHADQQRVIQATSGLISLFCCDFLPVQAARNLGLFALSHLSIARHQVAHQALGW